MKIEFASPKDQECIAEFQIKMALETENLNLLPSVVKKGVKAVFDDPSKGKFLVAVEESRPIASLMIVPEWSDWRNGTVYWIHSVYIIPQYRGKKVYKQMYQYLQKIVRSDDELIGIRLYVDKTNHNAQKAYEALGMTNEHYDLYEWLDI